MVGVLTVVCLWGDDSGAKVVWDYFWYFAVVKDALDDFQVGKLSFGPTTHPHFQQQLAYIFKVDWLHLAFEDNEEGVQPGDCP